MKPKTPGGRDSAPGTGSGSVTDPLAKLASGAHEILDRPLAPAELETLAKYLSLLTKWQRAQRLVGSGEPRWIVENLLLDSLLFLRVLPSPLRTLLDVGAGAGLPGIPLKIVLREVEVVLVESRRKRVSFLMNAIRELGLERVQVVGRRLEEAMEELEGRFDAVVMRCAGHPGALIPLGSRLAVSPGGVVIASGPPKPRPLPVGTWVTVEGGPGRPVRRFAVFRNS